MSSYPIAPAETHVSDPALIVVVKKEAGLRTNAASIESTSGADLSALSRVLASAGGVMRPLFGRTEGRLGAASISGPPEEPGAVALASFYKVEAPPQALDGIAAQLRQHDLVEAAYVKPPASPPVWGSPAAPSAEAPPSATPDFVSRQGYLNSAPEGIDAVYAWTVNGGDGANVRIVDIEGAWRFSHEDLLQNQGGVVGGTPTNDLGWRNHGTSVLGEFSGDVNDYGITGICPAAHIRAISVFGNDSSTAIRQAADILRPGDIILIELHRAGPRTNFQLSPQQTGYIAVEWWPDDFAAIQYAVGKGVVVVEAAGNGSEDLDDSIYDTPADGFPEDWSNPFRRGERDSGAILVGAGAPPPDTHGRDWGPDRSRLWFSNYGSCVDVQGWGLEVTSTGGSSTKPGDLQGGANEDEWYTDTFSGTSSASPIVVGALGCTQGARRAAGCLPLTPAEARDVLWNTGSPQQDGNWGAASQRIGNRPNLREIFSAVLPAPEYNDGIVNDGDTRIA